MIKQKSHLLNILYLILTILISIGFILDKRFDYLFNPAITSLFYLLLLLLERFSSFKTKHYIKLLLIITLTSHNFFGEYLDAYNKTNYFDNILHFFGSFSFALFAYDLINEFVRIRSSRPFVFTFLFVTIMGISLSTLFELGEFTLDHFLHQNNQRGTVDTNIDLVFDILGSMLAGFFMGKKEPVKDLD